MTPAAFAALTAGQLDNFIAAATPGGIERQEKQGQMDQSFAETLPVDMGKHRPDFEKLGFVFGKADNLFIEAKFPKGWRKKPTDHSMWSDLLDDKGRKRGMIFYKAAFYDQRAHVHLETRFRIADDYGQETRTISIGDVCGEVERKLVGSASREWADLAKKELVAWLDQNYPKWDSVMAYW